MKTIKIAIIALFLSMICTFSYAGSGVTSDWQKIAKISLGWDAKRVNITVPGLPDPVPCGSTTVAQADESVQNLDYILSVCLTALAAGKEVQLVIDDTVCSASGKPRLISVNVQ